MGTFSSTAIEIICRLKIAVAKAEVFPHLETREYGIQRTA
jgi:hypothetical protein